MKFSSKMDNLVLLIFLLTLFVFPLFIVGLIHYLMLKYTINKNGVKIDGLFKNIDILHKNIIKEEPKKYENSVISEDINLILAALNKDGVLITYLAEGVEKTVYISPENPQKFIDEVNKYNHNKTESKQEEPKEKELVIPEIVE